MTGRSYVTRAKTDTDEVLKVLDFILHWQETTFYGQEVKLESRIEPGKVRLTVKDHDENILGTYNIMVEEI